MVVGRVAKGEGSGDLGCTLSMQKHPSWVLFVCVEVSSLYGTLVTLSPPLIIRDR